MVIVVVVFLFAYTPTNATDRGCTIQLLSLGSTITQRIPPLLIDLWHINKQ